MITPRGKHLFADNGGADIVSSMIATQMATSRRKVAAKPAIIMHRDSMIRDLERDSLGFTAQDSYVFSNWSGYLKEEDPSSGWARAAAAGARTIKLQTSGHASPEALSAFALAMNPGKLIPVHGVAWAQPDIPLPPLEHLNDGQPWTIS